MTGSGDDVGPEAGDGPDPDLEVRRLRGIRKLLVGGGAVGALTAAAVGWTGGSGALGLGALLLVWALTAAIAGVVGLVLAIVDEWRRHGVARRRIAVVIGLLLLAFLLLVMAAGALGG